MSVRIYLCRRRCNLSLKEYYELDKKTFKEARKVAIGK